MGPLKLATRTRLSLCSDQTTLIAKLAGLYRQE
jgi:hypothetical protein